MNHKITSALFHASISPDRMAEPLATSAAHIDLKTVAPLPNQQTVLLITDFVIQTSKFLNGFSVACEQQLATVARTIDRLGAFLWPF